MDCFVAYAPRNDGRSALPGYHNGILRYSLGLSAWKQFRASRWSLRVNPSSGNLHPTEAYVVLPEREVVGPGEREPSKPAPREPSTPKERERAYGQPDHLRMYGNDFPRRLEEAGFEVTVDPYLLSLPPATVERYGLVSLENMFVCRKGGRA